MRHFLILSLSLSTVIGNAQLIENGGFETGFFHQNGQNWSLGGPSGSKALE